MILKSSSDKVLGEISLDKANGFVISNAKEEILNMCPMRNAKYISGNCTWLTDNYGRVRTAIIYSDNTTHKSGRDGNFIKKVNGFKEIKDADGNDVKNHSIANKFASKDDAGHLLPDACGGPSCAINIVPQLRKVNRGEGSIWRKSENDMRLNAQAGRKVKREIETKYEGKSLRPSCFYLTQTVDGKPAVCYNKKLEKTLYIKYRLRLT